MFHTQEEVLQEAVRCRTVTNGDKKEFEKLHECFRLNFPCVFEKCETIDVPGTKALLLKLKGKTSDRPVMLTGHMDVVPAGDESLWTHGPFSGENDGTWIWGRGSFDDKVAVVAALYALESLLEEGFVPGRDMYLGFSDNEEINGKSAPMMCEILEKRGVKLDMLLDEGGAVMEKVIPGMTKEAAVIGVAEKGIMSLKLTVKGTGGHSASPSNPESLARLGRALWRAEHTRFPVRWLPCVKQMFRQLSQGVGGPAAFVFRHNGILSPLMKSVFKRIPKLASFVRTTCVATMAEGSAACNIIPVQPTAYMNIRILPGDRAEDVVERIRRRVNDPKVEFEIAKCRGASTKIADGNSQQFALVKEAVLKSRRDAVVAPYLMVAASDALSYESICDNILRLSPVKMNAEELGRMHNYDERISVQNVHDACTFYRDLIKLI